MKLWIPLADGICGREKSYDGGDGGADEDEDDDCNESSEIR